MLATIKQDIKAIFERDPAVRSVPEVLLCYPGLHAIWGHRVSHWLWKRKLRLLARWVSHVMRFLTGIEIHPGATISDDFFIDHGMGIVIGETAEVGEGVTLYHGVTLGGTSNVKTKRHPTLEARVVVGAGAKILGPITVGADSRIGSNAVVVKDVPPNSVVVGVPGRIIKRGKAHLPTDPPDLDHSRMPDVTVHALHELARRVDKLEQQNNGRTAKEAPKEYVLEDYSI